MSRRKKTQKKTEIRTNTPAQVAFLMDDGISGASLCVPGYTSLDQNPEIMTGLEADSYPVWLCVDDQRMSPGMFCSFLTS